MRCPSAHPRRPTRGLFPQEVLVGLDTQVFRANSPSRRVLPVVCPLSLCQRADGHYAMRKTHDNDTTVYPTAAFWHYGGAGSALSVGLLDSISHQDWLECGRIMVCEGGDKRVGTCIQNLANITITNLKGLSSHLPLHPLSQLLPEALSWHKVEPLMAREFYRMEKKILLNITA